MCGIRLPPWGGWWVGGSQGGGVLPGLRELAGSWSHPCHSPTVACECGVQVKLTVLWMGPNDLLVRENHWVPPYTNATFRL